MKLLIELLHVGPFSCVIENDPDIWMYREKGVSSLYDQMQQNPEFLKGARVADKVVGKAAAALIVKSGIQHVYADVISEPAIKFLEQRNIGIEYGNRVPQILNMSNTDICPLEKLCGASDDLTELYASIEAYMQTQKSEVTTN